MFDNFIRINLIHIGIKEHKEELATFVVCGSLIAVNRALNRTLKKYERPSAEKFKKEFDNSLGTIFIGTGGIDEKLINVTEVVDIIDKTIHSDLLNIKRKAK